MSQDFKSHMIDKIDEFLGAVAVVRYEQARASMAIDEDVNFMEKFVNGAYKENWNEACRLGRMARQAGLPNECSLTGGPWVTPSGQVLKVYRSAWEQGYRAENDDTKDELFVLLYVMSDYQEPPGVKVIGHAPSREQADRVVEELMKPSRHYRQDVAILGQQHREACKSWVSRNLANLMHIFEVCHMSTPCVGWAGHLDNLRVKYGITEPVPAEPIQPTMPTPYYEEMTPWYGFFVVSSRGLEKFIDKVKCLRPRNDERRPIH